MLNVDPVDVDNRDEFVDYLCRLHNKVNKRLEKKIFECKRAYSYWAGGSDCSDRTVNFGTNVLYSDKNCSLVLGRAKMIEDVWSLFHSVAGAYPRAPTDEDKQKLKNLLNSLYFFVFLCFFSIKLWDKYVEKLDEIETLKKAIDSVDEFNIDGRKQIMQTFCKINEAQIELLKPLKKDYTSFRALYELNCKSD